ncbi:hypothetical protein NQZ79_g7772 [Umbelopsis isabellina]|nr:hypothetical protein NQZ79_g7772 [Umbelopsis isabellina]
MYPNNLGNLGVQSAPPYVRSYLEILPHQLNKSGLCTTTELRWNDLPACLCLKVSQSCVTPGPENKLGSPTGHVLFWVILSSISMLIERLLRARHLKQNALRE